VKQGGTAIIRPWQIISVKDFFIIIMYNHGTMIMRIYASSFTYTAQCLGFVPDILRIRIGGMYGIQTEI